MRVSGRDRQDSGAWCLQPPTSSCGCLPVVRTALDLLLASDRPPPTPSFIFLSLLGFF
jgi:hypothetical protein